MKILIDVPLHITSMWYPIYTDNPRTTGSIGAGIVIRPGLNMVIENGETTVTEPPHIKEVLSRYGIEATIRYNTNIPLGVGYGMSGAVALGTALGAAALLGRSLLEAAQVAHEVEVDFGTGLGDVIAEFYGGGVELRVKQGAPGIGIIDRIPYPSDLVVLTHEVGFEDTRSMLARLRGRLETIGKELVNELIKEPTYENFLRLSLEFSRAMGFLNNETEDRIKPCIKYLDGYYAKKGILVLLTYKDMVNEATQCLNGQGIAAKRFMVSNAGVQVNVIK